MILGKHMQYKEVRRTLRRVAAVAFGTVGMLSIHATYAATLNLPTTSSTGTFTVSYSANTHHYVSFLEVASDGKATPIGTDASGSDSGSLTISKPEGVYRYQLRLCERVTLGQAGNCTYTPVRSISVSQSSAGEAMDTVYTYDALGRLKTTKENGALKSGYCYDDAGNRKLVTKGGNIDACQD